MKTVIEFFEQVDNYSNSHGVWAEKTTPDSEAIVGEIPNNSGGYLAAIPPDGWVFLGTIEQIMDARAAWHEGLDGFDPFFVDGYLENANQ